MPVGIDNLARGLASKALKGLSNKANLVNGKIPADELPSYVDEVVEGYYYNNKFYKDAEHTQEITGEKSKIYVDMTKEPYVSYRWSGSVYFPTSGGGGIDEITADKVIYNKDTIVVSTVGGLKTGLNLKGRTVENIIERLVGAYVAPTFTNSSMEVSYFTVNARTGTSGNYIMGDTVQLQSIKLVLTKGTDYDGIVEGSIRKGNSDVYTLSQEEIESLNSDGEVTINPTDLKYTFPEDATSGKIVFSVNMSYNKKSYDANENVVVNKVNFSINSETISAQDAEVYSKLYFGALPAEAVLSGLQPDGTVSYIGGTVKFGKQNSLGKVILTTDDDHTLGVFVSEQELTDIKFMTLSDIENWNHTIQTMTYTRVNGTSYSKQYHVYSQVIAADIFTYELE